MSLNVKTINRIKPNKLVLEKKIEKKNVMVFFAINLYKTTTLNAKLECVYLSTNICDADVKIVVGPL